MREDLEPRCVDVPTLSAALDAAAVGLAITDADGTILHANTTLGKLLGSADLQGHRTSDFVTEQRLEAADDRERSILRRADGSKLEARVTRCQRILLVTESAPFVDPDRRPTRRNTTPSPQGPVCLDPLTKLAGTAALRDHIDHLIDVGRHFALCHLNLDQFSEINLSIGHDDGDRVLIEVGRRLLGSVRANDLVSRIGSDEFAVVFADVSTADRAVAISERVARSVASKPILVADHQLAVTASGGVALGTAGSNTTRAGSVDHVDETDRILQHAASALYRAKISGRNRIELYDRTLRAEMGTRDRLTRALRDAIGSRSFEVHYQPILDLGSYEIRSVEALVRWIGPDGDYVGPDEFIPIAESVGLASAIDRIVLERATRDLADLHERGHDLGLHANLSATQLANSSLTTDIAITLAASSFDPSRLCLELTETALATDPRQATVLLAGIADLGVSIAIDDFGTGYSSLEYLSRFAIDVLKIDRAFVKELNARDTVSAQRAAAIVRSILSLARELGLEVVAEGIETAEQRERLTSLGCRQGQGFLFSKPVAIGALQALLARQAKPQPGVNPGDADPFGS